MESLSQSEISFRSVPGALEQVLRLRGPRVLLLPLMRLGLRVLLREARLHSLRIRLRGAGSLWAEAMPQIPHRVLASSSKFQDGRWLSSIDSGACGPGISQFSLCLLGLWESQAPTILGSYPIPEFASPLDRKSYSSCAKCNMILVCDLIVISFAVKVVCARKHE